MQFSDGWLHWNILFRCPPQDWEEASIDFFLDMLYSTNVRDVGVDRLCWKPALSRVSEVRSFYHSLSLSSVIDFPWKRVWKSKVPPRVTFFTWTVASRKILTIDNLWNRHIAVKEWCFMCKRCWESVDHFLLQCPIAYELWSMVFCLFGIHWLMLYKVSELLASWQGKFGMHWNRDLWRFVPHFLFWFLWWEQNARCFENCEQSIFDIKSFFFHTLLDWSVVLPFYSCFSLFDLIDCCNLGSWFVPL